MGELKTLSAKDLQQSNFNQTQLKELYQNIADGMDKLGYRKNRELLYKVKDLFLKNGMLFEVAHITKDIGISYYKEGNIAKAIRYVEDAVEILENNAFEQDVQETLVNYMISVGVGYYEIVNYSASLEIFQKCRNFISDKISDNILFRYYHEYSIVTIYVKNYVRAIGLVEKALQHTSNDTSKKADCYNQLGRCYWKMKKYKDSYIFYKRALDLFEVRNDTNGLAMIYNNLSILYDTMKDTEKAAESIQKCLVLFDKTNPEKYIIYFDTYIRVALRRNKFSEAVDKLLELIEVSNEVSISKRYILEPIELIVDKISKHRNEEYGIKLKKVIIDLINEIEDIEDKNKNFEERLYSNLGMLRYLFYSQSRRKKVRG